MLASKMLRVAPVPLRALDPQPPAALFLGLKQGTAPKADQHQSAEAPSGAGVPGFTNPYPAWTALRPPWGC